MTKQELRKLYLEKRLSLSEVEYNQQSEALGKNFFESVDLSAVNVLHIFLPITKKREPNTFLIIDKIQKEFPSIKISVPKINTETNTLESFYLNNLDELKLTPWGIPEPLSVNPTPSSVIDVVIVPLLVFDKTGHRLGYGKGFYDRFLLACKSSCKKIGLSLLPPIDMISTIEDHDQKLDLVVTPSKTFSF
jgi:5-formyltetrahydrofolate cyclo-ligase